MPRPFPMPVLRTLEHRRVRFMDAYDNVVPADTATLAAYPAPDGDAAVLALARTPRGRWRVLYGETVTVTRNVERKRYTTVEAALADVAFRNGYAQTRETR